MMIALGLLARHPHLRSEVLPTELIERIDFDKARVAAFNGRNDPENFIWGDIATQLGEAEAIKPYWAMVLKLLIRAHGKRLLGIALP